jgi:small subunit ribosomal protein S9
MVKEEKKRVGVHPRTKAHGVAQPSHPVQRYVEGVGRRKTAVARVRLSEGQKHFVVNNQTPQTYFKATGLQKLAMAPFSELNVGDAYSVSVQVYGGGLKAQAEAVRHGLSRALVLLDEEFKKRLRKLGFLTRDSRMVERKKYGLKKARRGPQWAKR